MIKDILTREERVRLECLAQAVQLTATRPPARGDLRNGAAEVLDNARRFEAFVTSGADTSTRGSG